MSNAQDDLVREHLGTLREESESVRAERIIKAELKAIGWKEGRLERSDKGDPGKVRIARRMCQKTTKTLTWIATRLEMGTWTYVSNLLREVKSSDKSCMSVNSEKRPLLYAIAQYGAEFVDLPDWVAIPQCKISSKVGKADPRNWRWQGLYP